MESNTIQSGANRAGLGKTRQSDAGANDEKVDSTAAYKLFPGDVAYVWHAGVHGSEVVAGLEPAGLRIRAQIIVRAASDSARGSRRNVACQKVRRPKAIDLVAGKEPEPVRGIDRQSHRSWHPETVEVMRRPIANNSTRGAIVYDPFLSSGTTLVAAETTDLSCYGLEIDPACLDVIIRRWQQLTGRSAVLESEGRSFDDVAGEWEVEGAWIN
jgi:hypothetical protein